MVVLVRSFALPPSLVLSGPPVPVSATFQTPTGIWLIVFDKDLQDIFVSLNQFEFRIGGWHQSLTDVVEIVGNQVSGQSQQTFPDAGVERFMYLRISDQLLGLDGLPVEAFEIKPDLII